MVRYALHGLYYLLKKHVDIAIFCGGLDEFLKIKNHNRSFLRRVSLGFYCRGYTGSEKPRSLIFLNICVALWQFKGDISLHKFLVISYAPEEIFSLS